jgi:gliding motility-associated-like protein
LGYIYTIKIIEMKFIKRTLQILLLVASLNCFGQGESWNWYFGYNAGVNFPNAAAPVAVTNGQIWTLEGVATISDAAGNLLFYTDGSTVWNKLHAVMTNGAGLMGNGSSTQSGVIIPRPGNPNWYYLFTCNLYGSGYRYSEIDMTMSAGNGAVVAATKNTLVNMNNTEKCCAVRHCNGVDFWIVTHGGGNNTWRCYLVTSAGINLTPVVSNVGSNHASPGIGYLKSSPDGKKLAYAVYIGGFLEILDFNNSTGVVTNPITINGAAYANEYGCEFSPDNSKVYFGSYSTMAITQVNLCAGTNAQIIASAMVIGTSGNSMGALQLAANGKIYCSRSQAPWLGVINNPNVAGVGCGYVDAGVSLSGKNAGAGLPNFISSLFNPTLAITSTVNCLNASFTSPTLNVTSCANAQNAISAYAWNFGDPASGPANTSALANPTHAYSTGGTFSVNLILTIPCGTVLVSTTVAAVSCSPQVIANSATICSGNCAPLTATASGGTGPYSFAWSPNIGVGAGPHNVCPGTTTIYTVTITDALNATATNTCSVLVNPTPTMNIVPSSPTMCMNNFNGSPNTLTITANGATTYTWIGINGVTPNTTSGAQVIATSIPNQPVGTGSIIGTIGSCTSMATFTVGALPNPVIAVTSATMCDGTSATISASGASSYAWTPFNSLNSATAPTVIATPTITTVYSVIGSSLNCNSVTETGTVTVNPNPTVTIAAPNATICAGSFAALNASGALSYTWSPANSLNASNIANVVANPFVNTNYVVIGTANGCTATAVQQISVIPLPNVMAVASKTLICEGEQVNINANGAFNYQWSPVAGLSSGTSNFVTASPAVTTVYTLLGSNGICTGTVAVTIQVVPKPLFNLSTSNQKICYGTSTTLFGSGAQFYNWEPNAGMTWPTPNTAIVSPTSTTEYTVTGYNVGGSMPTGTVYCDLAKRIVIEVVPKVTPVSCANMTICEGQSVKLSSAGGNTFFWLPSGSVNNPSLQEPYVSPSKTTVYTVQVSYDGNCTASATVEVKVNKLPQVDAGEDMIVNMDEPMFVNGTGNGTLKWISGEAVLCKDCPTSQIMPTNSGCYVIQAVSAEGCKATDEVCVEVTKYHNIYIPSVFTPNADGKNDVFLVYGTGLTKVEMTIFDRWGEKLYFSNDQLKGWDGTYKSAEVKQDVYPYLINYTTLDGKKHTKTGHVTLMK